MRQNELLAVLGSDKQTGQSIRCCLLISIIIRLKQFLIHFSYIILAYPKLYYPYNYKN